MNFDFTPYADGKTLCTSFLQQAIDAVPAGGTLVIPAGTYLTGSLFLKSNMTLELSKDAVILGVVDDAAYPPLPSRVAEQVLRRVVALDGLIDELCDEVELLLCRRALADEVVDAFDAQRLRDFLEDLEFAVTVEADAQDADVRAAEVEREVLARLLARRQADVRLEHAQRRLVRILEALAQVIAEVSRDFVEARSVDLEFLDDLSKLVLVKCHDYLPLYILK